MPRDLEIVCLKCLEKDPRQRYASADALADDLRSLMAGEPIAARPVGNAARLWMWCRRNPTIAAAASTVATALVSVAVLSLLYARQQTRLVETKTLYADEQRRRGDDQTKAAARINGLNEDLKKETLDLKVSLAETNRRLSMHSFERAQRAFDGGETNRGLIWLVECWRYAAEADDRALQNLARVNLSFWRYYTPELKGFFPHGRPVHEVLFSPDGKIILTRSESASVRLWDVSSSLPIGQPITHAGPITSAKFSPSGKFVLTRSTDNTARLWDVANGKAFGKAMEHQGRVNSVAFGPNGKTVLTGGDDKMARLWDAAAGVPICEPLLHGSEVRIVDYSPDGNTILTVGGNDRTARLWDAKTAKPIGSPMALEAHPSAAAFSPDGKSLVTGGFDKLTRLWDPLTGQPIGKPIQHADPVLSIVYSHDSKTVLTRYSHDDEARLWDARTWRPIGQPLKHTGDVRAAAFSPDGKTVLTGSSDRTSRIWDAATGEPVGKPLVHDAEVTAVAFSPRGETFLTGSSTAARLWSENVGLPMGKSLQHQGGVSSVLYGPGGTTVLTIGSGFFDKSICLWDAATGLLIGKPMAAPDDADFVEIAAFSPDCKNVFAVSGGNFVRLWDTANARSIREPFRLGDAVTSEFGDLRTRLQSRVRHRTVSLSYSPDGKMILTRSADGTVMLCDAASGELICSQDNTAAAVFGPDGKTVLTGNKDNTARLWDTANWRPVAKPMRHTDPVYFVAFSADGKTILTGSGRSARLWKPTTAEPIGSPIDHPNGVKPITFSPDSKSILAQIGLSILRVWSIDTGKPIGQPMVHPRAISHAVFSPDGRTIVTGSVDGFVRFWDCTTGQSCGPSIPLGGLVTSLAFDPNGRSIATGNTGMVARGSGSARLWYLPSLIEDDLPRTKLWVECRTGFAVDDQGTINMLDSDGWRQRFDSLRKLGGPPHPDSNWLFDPILYGSDPTARARAWMQRAYWVEAEAAFSEVISARPHLASAFVERARFYAKRSEPIKAAADFVRALGLGARDRFLVAEIAASDRVLDHVLALLPGDTPEFSIDLLLNLADRLARRNRLELAGSVLARVGALRWEGAALSRASLRPGEMFAMLGCPDQVSAFLARQERTTNPDMANSVAWSCILAPRAVADPQTLVRLAELAVTGFPAERKHLALNTLGAALYRAGRFDDAIRRLEEGMRLRNAVDEPLDLPFLAMAHHRLGHHDEAHRLLDRLRNRQPDTNANRFWDELEIRLLRSQAEAVILYDPEFPPDPFVR